MMTLGINIFHLIHNSLIRTCFNENSRG